MGRVGTVPNSAVGGYPSPPHLSLGEILRVLLFFGSARTSLVSPRGLEAGVLHRETEFIVFGGRGNLLSNILFRPLVYGM